MAQIIQTTFQFKRGDAERWNELNPILAEGEPGFELDTNKFKIGNGINTWQELPYKGEANIINAQTRNDFPAHGNENAIYKAQNEKLLYQWNPNISEYEALGAFGEVDDGDLITIDIELSTSSMNPVANKVITMALQDFVEDHYTKQEVDTAIENTNKRIDLLAGTTHFRGVYPNLNDEILNADLYEFSAGDIFIVENAEYICTTSGDLVLLEKANYEKLGDVTAEVERISVLEEKVGNEKDGDMEATGLYQTVASLENNKLDKTALNNYYSKEETYDTTEIDSLLQEIDNREEVTTLGELVDTIIGDDVGLSMRTVAVAVVAEIVGKAPEAFDTLEEIAAWIEAHPDDVAAIIKRISDLEASVDKKVDKTDIINTLDSTALDKPLSAAMGKELNSLIEELSVAVNGKVTETQVTTAISNALKDYSTTTAMQTTINTALADYIKQTELNGAINTALQTAKESGEFNGEDGVGIESIVQTNTSTTDGGENIITVTLTDGNAPTFKVKNGTKGDNGVSPTVTVTEIERGHRLTLVDANGTQTFDVLNGENTVDSATSEEVARMKRQQPNLFAEAIQTGNLIDISMMHDGGRVQGDGTINTTNAASFCYSDFVDISKAVGTHLAVYVMHKSYIQQTDPAKYLNYAQAVYRMCFYDAEKVKISYAEVGGGKIADGSTVNETNRAKAILEIPANAVYVRVSYTGALTTSSINKYMVVRGDEADLNPLPRYSEYEPAREVVVVPEDLNEQLDKLRGMGRYKHQDNAVQTVTSLNNSATFSENGITFVGDELWMMKDDASYTNGTRIHRYHVDGDIFSYLGYIDGDFGHLNTMDYCEANDCFIFGNGGNDEVTTGNYFVVVKNPLTIPYNTTTTIAELVAAGQAIKYDLDSTIGSIGFKVQALWGDSNLGANNRVILIASNATVIKEVLLSKTDGEFDGGISVLRSFTGMKTFGVQDADIWGDILYIGGQGQVGEPGRYLICEVSLTDPTKRNIIARDFYMEDGTPLTGCIQGIYVDADSIWIAVNAPSTQSPQVAITRYNRFDSISSAEAGAGVGIKSIAKTDTSGLVDTYTITFTDNTTATFTVTNGNDGSNGVSPTITVVEIEGGHRVSVTDAEGTKEFDVMDGKDGTDIEAKGAVKYDQAQDLTEEQKEIARYNIGAPSVDDIPDVTQGTGDSETKIMSQKAVTAALETLTTLPYGGSKEWLESNGDYEQLYQIDGYIWGYIESTGWTRGNIQYLIVSSENEMVNEGGTEYLLRNGNEGTVYAFTPASGDSDVAVVESVPETANEGDVITVKPTEVGSVEEMTDTSKQYALDGKIYAYEEVDVGIIRKQIFDASNVLEGHHMSGDTKIVSNGSYDIYVLPIDISSLPAGTTAYLEMEGLYYNKSGTAVEIQKLGYSALESPTIGDTSVLINKYFQENNTTYGYGSSVWTENGVIKKEVGYHNGSPIDGYDTIKTCLIETTANQDVSGVSVYLSYEGGMQSTWQDTGLSVGQKYQASVNGSDITWTDIGVYIEPTEAHWDATEETHAVIDSISVTGNNGDSAVYSGDGFIYTYIVGSAWMQMSKYAVPTLSIDGELSTSSTNAVQNKIVTSVIGVVESKANSNTTKIEAINERIANIETGGGTVAIPDVWVESVNECIAKIKTRQVGRNCITFPFFSDNHYNVGCAGILISHIMKECNIPFCLFGGDSITSGRSETYDTEAEMIAQDKAFDTMMSYVPNGRMCRAVGNHDGYLLPHKTNGDGITVRYTRDQIYDLFLREESIAQNKHFAGDGTYYYVDEVASKVRFVFVNTNGESVTSDQISWLTDTALVLPASDWAVVFISHHPITNNYHSGISNAGEVQEIIEDFITAGGEVIGWFAGHIHRDRIFEGGYGNVTYRGKSYAKFDENQHSRVNESTGATETYSLSTDPIKDPHYPLSWKTVTITSDRTNIAYDDDMRHATGNNNMSHAIDFVTVNRAERKVYFTRLGNNNGIERSYNY